MPPPTRREQLELDELLSDIYRGIETLPDNNSNYNLNKQPTAGAYRSAAQASSASASDLGGARTTTTNIPYTIREYNVKEYELPGSSPLVRQHKQELAALRQQQEEGNENYNPSTNYYTSASESPASRQQQQQQPHRSTLKRHPNTSTPEQRQQQQQQSQSLASFVTSTTPEIKRRVRIVEHPDKVAKGAAQPSSQEHQQEKPGKVKYVNTNKLIYHQESDLDDEGESKNLSSDSDLENNNNNRSDADDEDLDGVTRVEYYHTTWLDKHLGRPGKRRSSKELTEREIKEKAMIEELKRSLKNGAISLRQSLKGKSKQNTNSKYSETYDDQTLSSPLNKSPYNTNNRQSSSIFSGLATIPRNSNNLKGYKKISETSGSYISKVNNNNNNEPFTSPSTVEPYYSPSSGAYSSTAPRQITKAPSAAFASDRFDGLSSQQQQQQQSSASPTTTTRQQPTSMQQTNNYYSKTLPHNYNNSNTNNNQHQLLQSHYRSAQNKQPITTNQNNIYNNHQQNYNYNTVDNSSSTRQTPTTTTTQPYVNQQHQKQQQQYNDENMRDPLYGKNINSCAPQSKTLGRNQTMKSPMAAGETIGSMPSSSEVVRSALSRSNSQASLTQLNKTINLLPTSPSPYGAHSPMTPTQQLRAASPSLTPSPLPVHPTCGPTFTTNTTSYSRPAPANNNFNQPSDYSNYGQLQQQLHQQPSPTIRLQGTRVVESSTRTHPAAAGQPQQQQQPVYANPHAALMQHKAEQQMRQSGRNNQSSIREFNELDSLLRSLSPGSSRPTATNTNTRTTTTTTINQQQQQHNTQITPGYSSRPTQPAFGFGFSNPNQQPNQQQQATNPRATNNSDLYARIQKQQPNEQHHQRLPEGMTHQPYTIDVSDKKVDDACLIRQKHQEYSEFEPPVDLLLPSMEDYQNITRLNPVKNHYWYKPNMSRDRAISLLKDKPQGTFIVRDSTSFKGAFGLAVKVAKLPKNVLNNASLRNRNGDPSSELIRHFLIEPTSGGVRLKGYANESVYGSLPALIYQHSLTELALPCRLVIPRADIEDPNFNLKQKQYYDEFIASKEQSKHYPYDRTTTPNGGYRKYPGDVYIHNEHRIIFE